MAYRLVPFQFNNTPSSDVVFYLCDGDETPLDDFLKKTGDKEAVAKLETVFNSISKHGVPESLRRERIKRLPAKNASDLCEVRIRGKGTAARAFSFFIDGKQAIAIDFIRKVHSGEGNKATQDGKKLLNKHRYRLEEALEGSIGHGRE